MQVPDVVGERLARALQILEKEGLAGEVTGHTATDDPQKSGTVATTAPEAGAVVATGTVVSLNVFGPP